MPLEPEPCRLRRALFRAGATAAAAAATAVADGAAAAAAAAAGRSASLPAAAMSGLCWRGLRRTSGAEGLMMRVPERVHRVTSSGALGISMVSAAVNRLLFSLRPNIHSYSLPPNIRYISNWLSIWRHQIKGRPAFLVEHNDSLWSTITKTILTKRCRMIHSSARERYSTSEHNGLDLRACSLEFGTVIH